MTPLGYSVRAAPQLCDVRAGLGYGREPGGGAGLRAAAFAACADSTSSCRLLRKLQDREDPFSFQRPPVPSAGRWDPHVRVQLGQSRADAVGAVP